MFISYFEVSRRGVLPQPLFFFFKIVHFRAFLFDWYEYIYIYNKKAKKVYFLFLSAEGIDWGVGGSELSNVVFHSFAIKSWQLAQNCIMIRFICFSKLKNISFRYLTKVTKRKLYRGTVRKGKNKNFTNIKISWIWDLITLSFS